ncbi:MAG: hypothetical protein HY776_02915 [Actinobacteria bacterium]|nr:hypothetical protein [Actinomycetota bacterium]
MNTKIRIDEVLERVTKTSNEEEHKELIRQLCRICRGGEIYNDFLQSGKWKSRNALSVLEDFVYDEEELMFEENKNKASQFLRLALEAYENRDFKYLADVMSNFAIEYAIEAAENELGIDTKNMTIADFYSEIKPSLGNPLYTLNYFAESDHFKKERDDKFIERELALLTVCFESFFNNLEDEKLISLC